jgi:hypothetical protein
MKKRIIVIAALILFFTILFLTVFSLINEYGPNFIGKSNQVFKYESENGLYTLELPTVWKPIEIKHPITTDKFLITMFETYNPRAIINVHKFNDSKLTQDDIEKIEQQNISKLVDNQILSVSNENLGLYKGSLIEFKYKRHYFLSDYLNHCYSWVIPKQGGYSFLLCVDNSIWNSAESMFYQIIESIELID